MFVLCFASYCLQSSFLKKKFLYAYGGLTLLFVYFSHTYVLNESFTSIRALISNKDLMYSFSIIITIEAILGLLFNFYQITKEIKDKIKFLKYLPSPSFFISIYFIQVFVFLNFTGLDFSFLSLIVSLLISGFYIFLAVSFTGKQNLSSNLELKFYIHMFQIVLAGVLSVIYSSFPINSRAMSIDFMPLLAFVGLSIPVIACGFLWKRFFKKRV
jgi:hypothetical protein